jgi:signal transduction histidine kinase
VTLAVLLALAAPLLLAAVPAAADSQPPEHEETRELMALVDGAVAEVETKGAAGACEEFRRAGSRWFHDEVYVFVNDLEGRSLCHPAKPSLEGRSVLDLRDPHGKPIVESFQRETEDDGAGWVHYLWPRPGAGTNFHWKTSYVRRAAAPDRGEVIVGSGRYQMPMERLYVVEQVDDAVELLAAEGEAAFPTLRDKASGFRFYDSYVFVMDESGVHRVNAGFPEHEGENMLDFADADGKRPGRAMLALLADRDSGWVDYMWPRPGDDPASKKSTYVRKVSLPDGQTLIVGAGIYAD